MSPGKTITAQIYLRAIGFLFLIFMPVVACAQVAPGMTSPASLHLLGTYTSGFSDGRSSSGYSIGGFLQTSHVWGLESRGSYLHWGTNEHRYDALGGVRVGLHFARFSPYGSLLGGTGHVVNVQLMEHRNNVYTTSTGGEWKVLGGVDFYSSNHLSLRLGEISYAKVYVTPHTISPIDFSVGVSYRLPVQRR